MATPQPSSSAPKITVAMPVLNGGTHLSLAVSSIIAQTYPDWELLIVDDGSTDGALEPIKALQDPRIRIVCDGSNKGLATRLNEVIEQARGQYFARMDHDDVSYPERFARQLGLLESDPELDLVAVRAITISENNEASGFLPGPSSHREICARPWQGFYLPHPAWMGKTSWFKQHRYAEPAPYFCEDQELLLRSYAESRFATVDRVLFAYRVRSSTVWKKHIKTRWTLFSFQWRHFVRKRRIDFAFLALAALVARLGRDLLRIFKQRVGISSAACVRGRTESMEWQRVLTSIRDRS